MTTVPSASSALMPECITTTNPPEEFSLAFCFLGDSASRRWNPLSVSPAPFVLPPSAPSALLPECIATTAPPEEFSLAFCFLGDSASRRWNPRSVFPAPFVLRPSASSALLPKCTTTTAPSRGILSCFCFLGDSASRRWNPPSVFPALAPLLRVESMPAYRTAPGTHRTFGFEVSGLYWSTDRVEAYEFHSKHRGPLGSHRVVKSTSAARLSRPPRFSPPRMRPARNSHSALLCPVRLARPVGLMASATAILSGAASISLPRTSNPSSRSIRPPIHPQVRPQPTRSPLPELPPAPPHPSVRPFLSFGTSH